MLLLRRYGVAVVYVAVCCAVVLLRRAMGAFIGQVKYIVIIE